MPVLVVTGRKYFVCGLLIFLASLEGCFSYSSVSRIKHFSKVLCT